MDDIYNDLIMEHSMNSYNKKEIECDYKELGHNPSCGDEITLYLKLDGNIIKDASFTGSGCAISQSSTSIMIDVLKGKTILEAYEIIDIFKRMIKREELSNDELDKLNLALAFKNISNMPARVKCVLLPFNTMKIILDNNCNK